MTTGFCPLQVSAIWTALSLANVSLNSALSALGRRSSGSWPSLGSVPGLAFCSLSAAWTVRFGYTAVLIASIYQNQNARAAYNAGIANGTIPAGTPFVAPYAGVGETFPLLIKTVDDAYYDASGLRKDWLAGRLTRAAAKSACTGSSRPPRSTSTARRTRAGRPKSYSSLRMARSVRPV